MGKLASGRHSHKGHRGKRPKNLSLHTCCEFSLVPALRVADQSTNYIKF